MKRAYTTMALHYKKNVQHFFGGDWEKAQQEFKVFSEETAGGDKLVDTLQRAGFFMEREFVEGSITNIFMPGIDFCNWLVSCVKSLDDPEHVYEVLAFGKTGVKAIHFPSDAGLCSCLVWGGKNHGKKADPNKKVDILIFVFSKGNTFGETTAVVPLTNPMHDAYEYLPNTLSKLVIGLGMYMSCFPEAVRDGIPDDLKHPSFHQHDDTITISVANKIVERISHGGTHASPITHFRKGHFRILRSDKFTNKRFQAVFVSETFVNRGKAVTVLSPEEVDAYA